MSKFSRKKTLILLLVFCIIVLIIDNDLKKDWSNIHTHLKSIFSNKNILFRDFNYYFNMSRKIFITTQPVNKYYYPAFFALLLYPLTYLTYTQAMWVWGIINVLFTFIFFLITGKYFIKKGSFLKLGYFLLFITSIPVIHNFLWGQISIIVTLLVFLTFALYDRGYRILGALFLALAVSMKYYPIIFVFYFIIKKDKKFLLNFVFLMIIFIFIIPVIFLGINNWIEFHKFILSNIIHSSWISGDLSSQYIVNIIDRILVIDFNVKSGHLLKFLLKGIGYLLALFNLYLVFLLNKKKDTDASLFLSIALIFLSIPFVIKTSWTHYFCYIPLFQVLLIDIITTKSKSIFYLILVVLSIILMNIFVLKIFTDWKIYFFYGFPFISAFFILITLYSAVFTRIKKPFYS